MPAISYVQPRIAKVTLPQYEGDRYTAVVPDTLDLARMAELAIHGLTSCTDPKADYETYWWVFMHGNRPVMRRDENDAVPIIMQRAIPLMRLICGTRDGTPPGATAAGGLVPHARARPFALLPLAGSAVGSI